LWKPYKTLDLRYEHYFIDQYRKELDRLVRLLRGAIILFLDVIIKLPCALPLVISCFYVHQNGRPLETSLPSHSSRILISNIWFVS